MSKKHVPPTGELRQSQVLTTFGPGAMVDLPNHSVLIGGLEGWIGDKERIYEVRLEEWLKERLDVPELKLFAPPVDSGDGTGSRTGIAVHQFPAWFLGQVDQTFKAPDGRIYRTRPLIPWDRLVKGGYLTAERRVVPVVPFASCRLVCAVTSVTLIGMPSFERTSKPRESESCGSTKEGRVTTSRRSTCAI